VIDLRQDEAHAYRRAQRRRGRYATAVSAVVIVAAALAAGAVDDALPGPAPVRAALIALLLGAAHEAFELPFAIVGHRASVAAGLSVQSGSSWLADRAKGWAIAAILGLPAAALLVAAQRAFPDGWPYLGWAASLLLALVITVIAPVVLLPLFLRSERLADGPLRSMAEQLVAASGLRVGDIRLLVMSEKTTTSNAAVVGLGPTRRILLGDTLTGDEADPERLAETRAVLAHELAHHAHGDIWRGLGLEAATSLVLWPLAAAVLAALPASLAHGGAGDPASLPAFAIAYGVLALPLGLLSAWHSRRRERAADAYAFRLADGASFARAMERLVASNLAELWPPRLTQVRASHPPSGERIETARRAAAPA
jgi:Zn-dependent protease with chaperone function